jgi:formylmethanofuran dehydrogenase subunit E
MTQSIKSYNEAVAFHGHACPGLALGYRAAEYALQHLRAGRSEDEDLVAIVENDACGVDAIQLVAGCSVGKGNLILQDFGKHAYTFIDRKSNRAIRLVQRPEPVVQRIDPVASALREKVMGGTATPAEHKEFAERQAAVIEKILKMPIDELSSLKKSSRRFRSGQKSSRPFSVPAVGRWLPSTGHVSGMVHLSACLVPESTVEGGERY